MSPQPLAKRPATADKNDKDRTGSSSPASTESQQNGENDRGRKIERDGGDGDKMDEAMSGDDQKDKDGRGGNGERKRKRSRKGLDKKYMCPQHGCGKSYSRAEHLYRHQLNRK